MKNDKQKQVLLEQLKRMPVVQISCEKADVSRATFYRWKKDDAEFAKMADEAILEGSFLVNDMAESQLMSAIRDKNMTAIIFWLKHHHQNYGTKIEVNANIKNVTEELTQEQKEIIREALRLASIDSKDAENSETKDYANANTDNNRPDANRP